MAIETFIPILFKVLLGFISLNVLINLILCFANRNNIYLKLLAYWTILLPIFLMQSLFQHDQLSIILAFSLFCIPTTLLASLCFNLVSEKFPLKRYLAFYATALILTFAFQALGFGFTVVAMPLSLACCIPLLHAAAYILIFRRNSSSPLQKFLGFVLIPAAIHGINFALFRMETENQLWGWLITYALYDVLAILLPSIALEEANISKNARLATLVQERTSELGMANTKLLQLARTNESLLKVVLHDIAGPVMVSRMLLSRLNVEASQSIHVEHINKSFSIIEDILKQIKTIYNTRNNSINLTMAEVEVDECIKDLLFVFNESMLRKNIALKFDNKLPPQTKIRVERTSFTHSVLGNLISNAMKFSPERSHIEIIAEEKDDKVVLEIRDKGIGMSEDYVHNILNGERILSTPGTDNESGSGFGLFIVKSFIDLYDAKIEIHSKEKAIDPENHGTRVRLTLNKVTTPSPNS